MASESSIVVFLVSLLIGGLGIYVGAWFLASSRNYGHAVVTAALGSVAWWLVALFVGDVWLLGPVLVLLAYLGVIKVRYRTGWLTAAGIALVAWITVLVVLAILSAVGAGGFVRGDIPGVPNV